MNMRGIAIICAAALFSVCAASGAMATSGVFAKPNHSLQVPSNPPKMPSKHGYHPLPTNTVCLPAAGRTSNSEVFSNDPANSVVLLNIGVGNAMTGASVEASVEAFAPSLLYNSILHFSSTSEDDPNGIYMLFSPYFHPGVDEISTYGLELLSDYSLPNVAAGADGILRIEWFDRDIFGNGPHLNPNAVWSNAANPRGCQGIYVTCTDQAACDAAALAAGGVAGGLPAERALPTIGKAAIGVLIAALAMIVYRRRKHLLRAR